MILPALALLGAAGMAAARLVEGPLRFWANWLVWLLFLTELGTSALFLVAMDRTVRARWSVPLRRVMERLAGLILLALPFAAAALFFLPVLYPWARSGPAHGAAGKDAWLNIPAFAVRAGACFAAWLLFLRVLVGRSLRQDRTGAPDVARGLGRWAPAFLVVYGLTVSLLGFDWVMSLQPRWFSDIFGVYTFAGAILSGLSGSALAAVWLLARGRLPGVRPDHLYSLGGYIFAFTVFWAYIAFAQYMLIWYADLPDESFWYVQRACGSGSPWTRVALLLALVHFVIPFFALIPRGAKAQRTRLLWVCSLVLFAHLADLYWLIFPAFWPRPMLSWPELSAALFFVSCGLLWVKGSMRIGEDMPVGDPSLEESLAFRL